MIGGTGMSLVCGRNRSRTEYQEAWCPDSRDQRMDAGIGNWARAAKLR